MRRQALRLLAILSTSPSGAAAVLSSAFMPWLHVAALSADCRAASHAARTLLHIQSATAAAAGTQQAQHQDPLHQQQLQEAAPQFLLFTPPALGSHSNSKVAELWAKFSQAAALERPIPAPQAQQAQLLQQLKHARLVLHDGVHLFDPGAAHHWALACNGTDDTSRGELLGHGAVQF